jgi:hypothetical protein
LIAWLRLVRTDPFFERLGLLLVVLSFAEILGGVLSNLNVRNMLVYNISWPLEFVLLLGMFMDRRNDHRKAVLALGTVVLLIWLAEVVHDAVGRLSAISICSGAVVIAGLYTWLLWELSNTHERRLRNSGHFWVYVAIVIYFSACTPILGTISFVNTLNGTVAANLYWILQGLCIVHYVLLGVGCTVERRNLVQRT